MKLHTKVFAFSAVACVALLAACMYLDSFSVDQPQPDGTMAPKGEAGSTVTFTINGHVEVAGGDRGLEDILVFGMLAPRCWDIANNATLTLRGSEVLDWDDEYTMSLIPASASPKSMAGYTWPEALMERSGLGPNRYNDMEWVAWQSDIPVQLMNGSRPNFEVTVKLNLSDDNLVACLGFFFNYIDDGLSTDEKCFKTVFSDPFTVYGGDGETTDYTKLRFNSVEPSRSLPDDFITVTFAGDSFDNELEKEDEIFIEGTAYTAEGNAYPLTKRDDQTRMIRQGVLSHSFSVTFWPVGLFGVPDDETITHIDYIFTNRDGSKTVTRSFDKLKNGEITQEEFDGLPKEEPYTFNFVCGV